MQSPIGIAQHCSGEKNGVCLARGNDLLCLLRLGNQTDRAGGQACFLADSRRERHLVPRLERNLDRGRDSAARAVDQIHSKLAQAPGEADRLLDIPSSGSPIGRRNPNEQRQLLRPGLPDRFGDAEGKAGPVFETAPAMRNPRRFLTEPGMSEGLVRIVTIQIQRRAVGPSEEAINSPRLWYTARCVSTAFFEDPSKHLLEIARRLETVPDQVHLLEALFAFAPVAYQVYSADGLCLLTNKAFRDLFGAEPPPEYNVLRDEIAKERGVLDLVHRAFGGETVSIPPIWYDPRELKHVEVKEGKRIALSATFFPLLDKQRRVTHVAIAFKDLTAELLARDEAEARREEAETKNNLLHLVLEQSGAGVIIADEKGVVRVFNAEAERQHGVMRRQVAAPQWAATFGLLDEDDRPLPLEKTPLYRAFKGETVKDAHWRVRRPDGEVRTLSGTATPLLAENRALAGAVLVTRDETERLRTERQLQFQSSILTNVRDSVVVTDLNGRITYWNEGATRIFGYSREEMLGNTASVLYAGETQSFTEDLAEVAQRADYAGQWKGRRKDGSDVWVDVRRTLMHDTDGTPIGYIGVSKDITLRKRAEEQLRQESRINETLHRLAASFATELEFSKLVHLITDESRTLTGADFGVFVFQPSDEKELAPPPYLTRADDSESPASTASMLAAAFALACDGAGTARLADLRKASAPWQGAPTREGVPPMVSCLAIPVRTRSGEHLGALVLGHREANHFTEQHERIVSGMTAHAAIALENARLYQALRLREEEARARVEFEKQLVGIVSHDLKNPLGAIAMSAALLLKRGQLDEQQGKAIARIVSSTERANRLIGDFLDYTQARAGGAIPVNRAACDLHRLAAQVIDEVRLAHPDREIAVSTEHSGWGEWDGDRIAQVISNLVANAVQHSVPNSQIQIELSGTENEVVFKIKNQGLIPADILPNLFTPFQRGADVHSRSGKSIGLGLYIAKRLVQAHGGTIDALCLPDEGTTFAVRLPRGRVPPSESATLPQT